MLCEMSANIPEPTADRPGYNHGSLRWLGPLGTNCDPQSTLPQRNALGYHGAISRLALATQICADPERPGFPERHAVLLADRQIRSKPS